MRGRGTGLWGQNLGVDARRGRFKLLRVVAAVTPLLRLLVVNESLRQDIGEVVHIDILHVVDA